MQTVLGESGTGKTTMLDAFREVRERQGRPVLGMALAARAVRQLRDAHIRSRDLRTVAAFQAWTEGGGELPAGATVVVDEAGMVGTRDLIRIQEAVLAAGGELVLVGDDEQLAEIDAGGYFRSLHRRLCESHSGYQEGHELHQVLRQHNLADVAALRALREGDVQAMLANLDQRGLVFEGEDAASTERALIRDRLGFRQSGHHVLMLARTRHRVSGLNTLAQAVRYHLSELGEESVRLAGNQLLRAGDHVRFREARRELDLVNGSEGTVEQVDATRGSALIRYRDAEDRERRSWFGSDWLRAARRDGTELVQLNYAATGNVAQGSTAEVLLVGKETETRNMTISKRRALWAVPVRNRLGLETSFEGLERQ